MYTYIYTHHQNPTPSHMIWVKKYMGRYAYGNKLTTRRWIWVLIKKESVCNQYLSNKIIHIEKYLSVWAVGSIKQTQTQTNRQTRRKKTNMRGILLTKNVSFLDKIFNFFSSIVWKDAKWYLFFSVWVIHINPLTDKSF